MKKILFIGLCCLCLCGCNENKKIENDLEEIGNIFVKSISLDMITNSTIDETINYDGTCIVTATYISCETGPVLYHDFSAYSTTIGNNVNIVSGTLNVKNNIILSAELKFPQISSKILIYDYNKEKKYKIKDTNE